MNIVGQEGNVELSLNVFDRFPFAMLSCRLYTPLNIFRIIFLYY